MRAFIRLAFSTLILPLFVIGCANNTALAPNPEAKIEKGLATLIPADRKLAEAQKYCAVQPDHRLGSMGKPIKLTIEDEPVFLCCADCEKEARKDPKKTLAKAHELQIGVALDQLDPADRKLAKEQRFCATEPESRLGSMGKPFKVMIKDQPVFLCCDGCEEAALKDPDKTLAQVKKLKAANAAGRAKE